MNRLVFEKYVQEYCLDLSLKPNKYGHRQKHACVITYNDVIISQGININLRNDFTDNFNDLKCLHAEASAIMRAMRKHYSVLHNSELWVCRSGRLSCYSRPCAMCMRIIRSFGIPVVHYTDDKGNWVQEVVEYE